MKELSPREDRRLTIAIWRWMGPPWVGRYHTLFSLKAYLMPRPRQRWFQWRLRRAGRRASKADLLRLLDWGWRGELTATWLIAAGRRADLRPEIEQRIHSDHPHGRGCGFFVVLACLGTEEDAQILVAYLNRTLLLELEPDGSFTQRQPEALGALMYLDEQLGTDHAQQFLAEDGLWHRWPGSADVSLEDCQAEVRPDIALATGGDPGVREMLKLEGGHRLPRF